MNLYKATFSSLCKYGEFLSIDTLDAVDNIIGMEIKIGKVVLLLGIIIR